MSEQSEEIWDETDQDDMRYSQERDDQWLEDLMYEQMRGDL